MLPAEPFWLVTNLHNETPSSFNLNAAHAQQERCDCKSSNMADRLDPYLQEAGTGHPAQGWAASVMPY